MTARRLLECQALAPKKCDNAQENEKKNAFRKERDYKSLSHGHYKRIIKEYQEQFYVHKFDNLDEI